MEQLPVEICEKIFLYLPFADLVRIQLVSQNFKYTAQRTIKKVMIMLYNSPNSPAQVWSFLVKYCPNKEVFDAPEININADMMSIQSVFEYFSYLSFIPIKKIKIKKNKKK